jgi:hypothetical protein
MREFLQTVGGILLLYMRSATATQNKFNDTLSRKVPYTQRMYLGLELFTGQVLFVISGNDLTAAEFLDLSSGSRRWRKLMNRPKVQRHDIAEANHTFSRSEWRNEVERCTWEWLKSW